METKKTLLGTCRVESFIWLVKSDLEVLLSHHFLKIKQKQSESIYLRTHANCASIDVNVMGVPIIEKFGAMKHYHIHPHLNIYLRIHHKDQSEFFDDKWEKQHSKIYLLHNMLLGVWAPLGLACVKKQARAGLGQVTFKVGIEAGVQLLLWLGEWVVG